MLSFLFPLVDTVMCQLAAEAESEGLLSCVCPEASPWGFYVICPHCLEREEWMFFLDYPPPLDVQTSESFKVGHNSFIGKEVIL